MFKKTVKDQQLEQREIKGTEKRIKLLFLKMQKTVLHKARRFIVQ